ncbi:MAG: phosphate regulon sensor histidine kinase PhoR [Gammaproteobacteria bacterium]|nr:phosphate regulon sensor histidine kinase PhoR [Gammaproteobacteria bacterium]
MRKVTQHLQGTKALIIAETPRAIGFAGTVLVLGAATDHWGYACFAALAAWTGWHLREFIRFARWSQHPLGRPESDQAPWAAPILRLYRTIAAGRSRSRRLVAQLRGLAALTEALPDAAIVIRLTGEIENFNSAAAQLLDLSSTERGNNLVSLIRHPSFSALVAGRVAGDLIEFALPRAPSQHIEARRIPIDDERLLILARDVTQLNRLLTMRQDFIANVSHELRTPLTVILGYLEALEEPRLDAAESRALLSRLTGPATRMKALVDDLLLLTRLESSPPPPVDELEPLAVADMLADIVTQARQLATPTHHLNLSADQGLRIRAAESEIHSAFSNLITNAVRYSPDGGPIEIRWFADDGAACFEVRDNGVGIAQEHLSRITERFYRVDLAHARVRGGTGLGLAITKHVLKRHGATLGVTSKLGQGSVFCCRFPAALTKHSPSNQEHT